MIYFKIVNHSANTNNEIVKIDNLHSTTFKNAYVTLINNVWYCFEDVLKYCGLSNDNITELKEPSYVQGEYSYLDTTDNNTYTLDSLDVYEVSNKYDTKGTKVDHWADYSNREVGYGTSVNTKFGDATLNDIRDRYFIIHSGNPMSDPANNPIIKWNGINGSLKVTNKQKVYSSINDINAVNSNMTFNIVFNDSYNLPIYKNGSLLETGNINKNDSRTYNLRPNDILEFKKSTETVPPEPPKIVHKDWLIPSATGITFTTGDSPISTIKLGEYTNVVLQLDDHYTWNDNQGKGLILNDGTVLGSWNGKNNFGINLEKYLDPEQLQTAHWDLNYTKTDFSDEHIQQIPIKLDLVHCKSDTNSILENSSKTVTLTTDDGYIFDNDIIYYYYIGGDDDYYKKITIKANKQNSVSFKIAVGSYNDYQKHVSYDDDLPTIKAVATKPDIIPTGTKAIHIYDMSDGEINTTMNSLIQKFGQNGPETVDFTKFINQIYRIPFSIPNDLTTDINNIQFGKYNVDVKTKQVNQDKLIIDGGSITVEPHYKNSNDYSPIECVLYLPFTKEVNLNINDIINHTINIKYNIDLLSGATTIIVSNENNEIYTGQFNISTSLEFYGLYEDKVVNNLNSTYINDILQAYIKLIYNKPIENIVSYETMEHGILKDYHGFTKISNINLQGTYNYNESTEINELLKQGVFINGITRN